MERYRCEHLCHVTWSESLSPPSDFSSRFLFFCAFLDPCFGLFVSFLLLLSYLGFVFVFLFFWSFLLFICCVFPMCSLFARWRVRELTLLFSHLQRQRNTKKVLHNSYHTLLSGLWPYSSPYVSGDRYAPLPPPCSLTAHLRQAVGAGWGGEKTNNSPRTLTHRHHTHRQSKSITGQVLEQDPGSSCMDCVWSLTTFH